MSAFHTFHHSAPQIPGLRLGGVPFEFAYRVFLHPSKARRIDQLRLDARRLRGVKMVEALAKYMSAKAQVDHKFWIACVDGQFEVRAKRKSDGAYICIPAAQLRTVWPHGPTTPNSDYEAVELAGPYPPWIKSKYFADYDEGEPLEDVFLPREIEYSDDFSYVKLRNKFEFWLGAKQARVIKILYQAATRDVRTWRHEKDLRFQVKCGEIADLFKSQDNWQELIVQTGKALWQLNLHSLEAEREMSARFG